MGSDVPELYFKNGLPGFPGDRRFTLLRWGADDGPYSVLVDLDDPDVRFLVAPPGVFFPDYEIEIGDPIAASVSLTDPADALVLVIVTLGKQPEDATANLLGPVVVNIRTREGTQAILAESGYSTRVPLLAAA
jgi:flagellar assembly factor FliW